MPYAKHDAIPVGDGFDLYESGTKVMRFAPGLARDEAEMRRLLAMLDRIHDWAAEAAARGERKVKLSLRREVNLNGSRTWRVREDRDWCVFYAEFARSMLDLRPSAVAKGMFGLIQAVNARARGALRTDAAVPGRGGGVVLDFRR